LVRETGPAMTTIIRNRPSITDRHQALRLIPPMPFSKLRMLKMRPSSKTPATVVITEPSPPPKSVPPTITEQLSTDAFRRLIRAELRRQPHLPRRTLIAADGEDLAAEQRAPQRPYGGDERQYDDRLHRQAEQMAVADELEPWGLERP
jgi:hypothetical protein